MEKITRSKAFSLLLVLSLMIPTIFSTIVPVQAASKATLTTKKITLTQGKSKEITIKKKAKKNSYTFGSSKKKIATVSKTGKVKAIKAGTTTITVKETLKINGKKVTRLVGKVKVTVKKETKPIITQKPTIAPVTPTAVPTTAPTMVPKITNAPTSKPSTVPTNIPTSVPTKAPTNAPTSIPTDAPALFRADFETDTNDFSYRYVATTTVAKSTEEAHTGTSSLKVSTRTESWHGAVLDTTQLLVPGESYTITAYVKQDTGTSQAVTCKLQYESTTDYPEFASVNVASGEWTKITGTATVPAEAISFQIYFEMSTTNDFYLDDVVIEGKKVDPVVPTDLDYNKMISNSLIRTGNNTRIKNAIEKARNGEDVTIAYIGGSITEGALASPNSLCYAYQSYLLFKKAFGTGDGSNIHFVNAGMSGTPSTLGIIRYDRDVLNNFAIQPDIVFVEFAVNDADDTTNGDAYESLVRKVLQAENDPAVVLLFSVFQSNLWNLQSRFIPIGEKYDLPMISIKNAISPEILAQTLANKTFFAPDGLHPTNYGHKIMADSIQYCFNQIDAEAKDASDLTIPETPVIGKTYESIKMLQSNSNEVGITINKGGFLANDTSVGTYLFNSSLSKFPFNWKHTTTADNTSFTVSLDCKDLLLVYKLSSSATAGSAQIWVDGVLKTTINSYNSDGWNNAKTSVIIKNLTSGPHDIKVNMISTDAAKEFTILGLGYTQ